jgi:protein-tyrosine phosphatase
MIEGPTRGTWWIEPGRLLAGPYPRDPATLCDAGVNVFFDLTHESDRLAPYTQRLAPGVRTVRRPIRDFAAPQREELIETLDLLQAELDRGNVVYLHCLGGIGRTGTVLGCYLVRNGLDGATALARLREIGKHPEAPEQVRLVAGWSED